MATKVGAKAAVVTPVVATAEEPKTKKAVGATKKRAVQQRAKAAPGDSIEKPKKPRSAASKAVKPDAGEELAALNARVVAGEAQAKAADAPSETIKEQPSAAPEAPSAGAAMAERLAAIRDRAARVAAAADDPLARLRGARSIPSPSADQSPNSFSERVRAAATSATGAAGAWAGSAAALVRNPSGEQVGEAVGRAVHGAVDFVKDHPVGTAVVATAVYAPVVAALGVVGAAGLTVKNSIDAGSPSEGIARTGEQMRGAVDTVRTETSKVLDVVRGFMSKKGE